MNTTGNENSVATIAEAEVLLYDTILIIEDEVSKS